MLHAIFATDVIDSRALWAATRAKHIEYLQALAESGREKP
jgi:uncharacterized protein YciI